MSSYPSNSNEDGLYVDPRRLSQSAELTESQGSWIDSPMNHVNLLQTDHFDDVDIDLDSPFEFDALPQGSIAACEAARRALRPQSLRPNAAHFTPASLPLSDRPLRPDAPEFIPGNQSRPHLTLATGHGLPAAQTPLATTPITPTIVLSQADDLDETAQYIPQSSAMRPTRNRRCSSPGCRPPARVRPQDVREVPSAPGWPMNAHVHLSPVSPESWMVGGPWQPGRGSHMTYPPAIMPITPQSMARRRAPSICSSDGRSSGPYFCAHPGCKDHAKAFDTRSELRHHQRRHLPQHRRPHACPQCLMRFQYPKDVRRHVRSQHEGQHVTCILCNRIMSRDDNLDRHIATQHREDLEMSFDGSSVASPSEASMTSFSPAVSGETLPSTPVTGPTLDVHTASLSLQQTLELYDPFIDVPCETLSPLEAPEMMRWVSNPL